MTAATLRSKIEKLPSVSTRPMFGYQCYLADGKFFAGFNKGDLKLIVRLPKELQVKAISSKKIKAQPFSHGAKKGWVEIDLTDCNNSEVFGWIKQGFDYAQRLSKV
jgi:hypothetical protein